MNLSQDSSSILRMSRPSNKNKRGTDNEKKLPPTSNRSSNPNKPRREEEASGREEKSDNPLTAINLQETTPIALQQLLLNVFKSALLTNSSSSPTTTEHYDAAHEELLEIKPIIQTIKSHLYNRDFDSAFTDASEELLRAYALRWSASRALGYIGVLKGVLEFENVQQQHQVICIGGGGGAEIAALAAVWRLLTSPTNAQDDDRHISITVKAVDIADWSAVVDRLSRTIKASTVPCSSVYPAPLADDLYVNFIRANVLSLSDSELGSLYGVDEMKSLLITLMFTINELFSTSVAKATSFLLRTTDLVDRGTVLLILDSPGSYSTVKLGQDMKERRNYPMKFLLDHAMLSVASGKWEKLVSRDSMWWRRDASRLRYDVGGEGSDLLEDMRFQVHIYLRM